MKKLVTLFLALSVFSIKAQTQESTSDKIINENYTFRTVQTSQCYINKIGDYTFFSETDYIDFCNANFGLDSKIPFIDFNSETAVIIFTALSKSPTKPFVDSSVETEHYIKVNVKNTEPQKDIVVKAARNQYIIVAVKKSNKEIKVVHW